MLEPETPIAVVAEAEHGRDGQEDGVGVERIGYPERRSAVADPDVGETGLVAEEGVVELGFELMGAFLAEGQAGPGPPGPRYPASGR